MYEAEYSELASSELRFRWFVFKSRVVVPKFHMSDGAQLTLPEEYI